MVQWVGAYVHEGEGGGEGEGEGGEGGDCMFIRVCVVRVWEGGRVGSWLGG